MSDYPEFRTDSRGVMLRPSLEDKYVLRRAAELLLPSAMDWLRRGGGASQPEKEVLEDLMAMIAAGNMDGYERANYLERHRYWYGVNADLVELLNEDTADDAIREMTRAWVRCLGLTPVFSIGSSTSYEGRSCTVDKIYTETAEYGIRFPDSPPNTWRIIPFEALKATVAA